MKTAVIGTGVIAEQHLTALRRVPDAQLAAVCDLSPAMARDAADRFGAKAIFTDYQQMLADVKPDVVHVLTPPQTHLRLVSDCLTQGSHVIVEKPIAPTHNEFLTLWQLAQSTGRNLVEDHNYRFNQPIRRIDNLLATGRLGQVEEVEVRMALNIRGEGDRFSDRNMPHPSHRLPAGVLHEFITHLCYLTLHFMPVKWSDASARVAAAWSNHSPTGPDDLFRHDDLDALLVLGHAHARIRFSSRTAPDAFAITVRGSQGYAECDLFQPYVKAVFPRTGGKQLSPIVNQIVGGATLAHAGVTNFKNKIMQRSAYEGLHHLIEQTYHAINNNQPMPVTFDDMNGASQLVDALLSEANRL
jgi:predicted dehydrogenase